MLNKSKVLRTAEKYVIAGKFAQAVGEYEKLIKQDPDEPMLLNTVGDLLVRQGRTEEALGYYRKVVELYLTEDYHVKATAMLKKLLLVDPDDLRSRERLAGLYEKLGLRYDSATHLRLIIEAREKAEDYSQALEFAERLTDVLPADAEAWRNRARLALRSDKGEAAVRFFTEAVTKFQQRGDSGEAWQTLMEVVPLDSSNRRFLDLLVEVAESGEQLQEARSMLEGEIEATGEDFPYRFYLGLVLEKLDQQEEAGAQYRILQEKGFHDQRVTEALIRVGQLEPQEAPAGGGTKVEQPAEAGSEPEQVAGLETGLPDMFAAPEEAEEVDFPFEKSESSEWDLEAASAAGEGSGLFDLEAMSDEFDSESGFQLDESPVETVSEPVTPPEEPELPAPAPAPSLELPAEDVSSLDEALEEVDFYLKQGFRDDAIALLQRLLQQFPSDERVLNRARKARVPIPAPAAEEVEAPPLYEEAAEEAAELAAELAVEETPSASVDFEHEIESALDGLFVGSDDERQEEAAPVLRYDIAAGATPKTFQVHYDLGLAYKEMGLLEDAVGEFSKAFEMIESSAQNPQKILCCSVLASSFLLLGRLDEVIEWARKGLALPDLKEFESKALQYDLALALERNGESEEAKRVFQEIATHDKTYRDVEKRLKQLGA